MEAFLHQVFAGLATGGIYASLALALVMIHNATRLVNFAQGEMAMFATYLCWTMIQAGWPYWGAFFATVVLSFVLGVAIERILIRPVERAPVLTTVVVFIGLLLILNSVAGWIYTYTIKSFPSPFPSKAPFGLTIVSAHELGAIGVTLVVLLLVYLFFRFTPLGLAMRAAAQNPDSSRLVGINAGYMLMLGWALASALGALAGTLVAAQSTGFDASLMASVLVYAFAAAALGGFDSPLGAVIAGLFVGIADALTKQYINALSGIEVIVPLGLILIVLLVRPTGLFGRRTVERV